MNEIFTQTSLLFTLTIGIALIVRLLKQPLMIAYIIAGIIAGPLFLNLIHGDQAAYDAFAEFGVVLLLFVIGLSLQVSEIKKIGRVSVLTGLGQIAFTATVGFVLLQMMGFSVDSSLYLAVAITFSSTIIIMKLLADKKDTEKVYARYTIGLMLVQDLIALVILIAISILQQETTGSNALTYLLLKSLLVISLTYFMVKAVLPHILKRIAASQEFLFIFTLAWCFGVASFIHWLGFSLELGAIIAGLMLASTPYQPEISSRIKPIRDFFIIIFFIILGSRLGLGINELPIVPGLVLSLFILIGNPLILYFIFRSMRFTRKNSFLAGITAAQVSEFGFVLLLSGERLGVLNGDELPVFTLVALTTIFFSSYLITYGEKIYHIFNPFFNLFGPDKNKQAETPEKAYDIWIFGYHQIGAKLADSLMKKKMSFAVVDYNPDAIDKMHARGIPYFFGDAEDIDFLEELPIQKSKLIISTIAIPHVQKVLVSNIRRLNKKIPVIMTLEDHQYVQELYDIGANYVSLPNLLSGQELSAVVENKAWNKRTLSTLHTKQKNALKLAKNIRKPTKKR